MLQAGTRKIVCYSPTNCIIYHTLNEKLGFFKKRSTRNEHLRKTLLKLKKKVISCNGTYHIQRKAIEITNGQYTPNKLLEFLQLDYRHFHRLL